MKFKRRSTREKKGKMPEQLAVCSGWVGLNRGWDRKKEGGKKHMPAGIGKRKMGYIALQGIREGGGNVLEW